jgi:aldose 1-epimerase
MLFLRILAAEMKPLAVLVVCVVIAACKQQDAKPANPAPAKEASVTKAVFGTTPAGETVDVYTMTNPEGMEVRAITYGGIITVLRVPDRDGRLDDIALGFDNLEGYLKNPPFFGAIIGRYGNRIGRGRFTLDGKAYTLAINNAPNHLHGGVKGFDKVVWQAESFKKDDVVGVVFTHTSPDGDQGYPGNLSLRVTYTLTPRNELEVEYEATTDKPTPVNLTQHTYFNLAGDGSRDVLDHMLTLHASRYTPVDATLIPSGGLATVEGTPFDFRMPTAIGARIAANDAQIRYGNGYDHNYVIDRTSEGLVAAAHVMEPMTGRVLDVSTTEPGMQFYTGNFLDGTLMGKRGHVYKQRMGFCLETQHFPDSPNKPTFPNTILRPGETFRSKTVFAFSVSKVN